MLDSNSVLFVNRNVHGLVKTICKLVQIQAVQLEKDGDESVWSLYGIRLVLHSFIRNNNNFLSDFQNKKGN